MAGATRATSTGLRLRVGSLLLALGTAIAAAATQVPARAGAPSPDKTIPTLPPQSSDVAATTPDASVADTAATVTSEVVAPASSVTDVETGIPLRAGAGPAELLAAANRALQSDVDVAAGLGGFAVIPAGIPTPAGTIIGRITVSYPAGVEHYYVAHAELTTTATADDVVAYYRTVLAAEGFALVRDHNEASVHELEFARRESGTDDAEVVVSVDSSDGVLVDIEITDRADAATLEAFASWPAGLPGLDEGRPIDARVTATRDALPTMTVSTTFAYEGTTVDALTTRIRDGLASGGGFSIADDDEGGATIRLEHEILTEAAASISDADGVTLLRVDGSLG